MAPKRDQIEEILTLVQELKDQPNPDLEPVINSINELRNLLQAPPAVDEAEVAIPTVVADPPTSSSDMTNKYSINLKNSCTLALL